MNNTQGNIGAFELFFKLLANLVTLKIKKSCTDF